ncbi:CAZyme family GT90 [Penicillium citrinum]|uniref:CAZyme family GT90 n=2 Tax=Penicillium TaxID=5073 RepID=A0A9W9NW74_PENCI|nr:CAZyme family GT90 [Penicillium citrinum]KAJ5227218.1 CAZyme family GT90 [Penicillium citrinum]KAJ5568316.1 CAZyme family GT90 [Penicillium hetheringtonii]
MNFARNRQYLILASCTLIVLGLLIYWRPYSPNKSSIIGSSSRPSTDTKLNWSYPRDRDNFLLTQDQCDAAFPELFVEIERARNERSSNPITFEEIDSIQPKNGYIRAMIYDQQLYIIAKEGSIWTREIATLAAINRALVTSPEPLPNIEFAFNTDDRIEPAALWGYARRDEDKFIWLIPDFGFWSWPEIKAGSTKEILMKIEEAEQAGKTDWTSQIRKLFWRGVARMGPEIRDKLLAVTENKEWADVKELGWGDAESMKTDYKTMPDHCEYKYIAQTEGNTYSGRLKYLQMCRSVVVSHKLNWIQHHYHLLRSSGSEQNFVEVERDWSDLEEKMLWLESHDADARRIADNNVKVFRERYLTQSAEVCYWRRLIREWAAASNFEPEFYKKDESGNQVWRGLSFESFMLMRKMEWQT